MGMWGRHLAAAGLLAITVTGCGDIGDLPSVEPQAPAAATATVRQSDTSSAPPDGDRGARSPGPPAPIRTPATSPKTAPVNPPPRTSAPVPACTSRALTASLGHTGLPATGRSGWFATQILLRNHSGSTCHLRGWPGLAFFGDGVIQGCSQGDPSPRCGKPLSTSGPRAFSVIRASAHDLPDILLAPARTTFFTIVWQGSYAGGCVRFVDPAYGVEIRVPGDSRALSLTSDIQISPCEGELQVGPFGVVS
ncbi:DUF4232 domain-containing protein [Streptomyces sp. WAC07094]|uniref:DUF4232 domain-containing protein n=1 Tax=Streptomyces sp. WAC07094 TaxID=3072183 RepID=UPI002ECDC49F|nr:DUF4232 domain-containing protein [Streptomyces sp. WAC07094]